MNEQMKALLDWAKDHASIYVIECELANIPFDQEEYDRRFQEKFAELVVRECIGLAHDVCLGDEAGEHGDTVSLVVDKIERHFELDK